MSAFETHATNLMLVDVKKYIFGLFFRFCKTLHAFKCLSTDS